jgi:acetoin utilization deacetylase AcuC-like enzyme
VGRAGGTGFTLNVPWDAPGMGDADYLAAMEQVRLALLSC